MLQGKECGSIYFIIEKFPREVKCLCQGYIEVKSRNHSDCLPLRKCDLIGQWCLSQEMCLLEQLSGVLRMGLTAWMACLSHPRSYTGLRVRVLHYGICGKTLCLCQMAMCQLDTQHMSATCGQRDHLTKIVSAQVQGREVLVVVESQITTAESLL